MNMGVVDPRGSLAVGALLREICRGSEKACALLAPDGTIAAQSPLFERVRRDESDLDASLCALVAELGRTGHVRLERAWSSLDGYRLAPIELVFVRIYGAAVARARLSQHAGAGLSPRELECMAIALEGHANTAIAARLGVRPETVKVHLRNAYRKLDATGRATLLARMVEA